MGQFLDSIPFSGIIRIRDMMYSVTDPFRLDQGDVSFDAPDSVKKMRTLVEAGHDVVAVYTRAPKPAGSAGGSPPPRSTSSDCASGRSAPRSIASFAADAAVCFCLPFGKNLTFSCVLAMR